MNRRGFTLIELLVVISIIALLSGVVLASLNVARERGRLGAAKQFAASVDHIAGDEALVVLDFDDCPTTTAIDSSRNGNNGSLSGGAIWNANTPNGSGCSMFFDGVNDYVSLGTNNANLDLQDLTVSHWIYANSLTSGLSGPPCGIRHPSVRNRDWGWGFNFSSTGGIYFGHYYNSSAGEGANAPAGTIQTGKWYQVVGVKNGATKTIYVDGKLVASGGTQSTVYYDVVDFPAISFEGCGSGHYYWDGYIDSVHVFNKTLTASEIEELYASEASRFMAKE